MDLTYNSVPLINFSLGIIESNLPFTEATTKALMILLSQAGIQYFQEELGFVSVLIPVAMVWFDVLAK